MNLLLLEAGEVAADGSVTIRDPRRLRALLRLELQPGRLLRAGLVDGALGSACVEAVADDAVELRVALTDPPPPPSRVELVLALPRPKMLRRILRGCAEAGVKRIWLLNSARVDKSYWQSPLLSPPQWQAYFREGLEQVGDTMMPKLELAPRFRPFAEDDLPGLCRGRRGLLALAGAERPCPGGGTDALTVAVGPEGGYTPFEIGLLENAGLEPVSLGQRVYRVETAVTLLLGRLG
jgi:RsmE family RNA methyltransferase